METKRLGQLLNDSKGETMIEVVTSLALFAITMVLVATLFTSSNRILVTNIQTSRQMNKQLDQLNMDSDLEALTTDAISFELKYLDNKGIYKSAAATLELVAPKNQPSGFAKYRIQAETEGENE